MTRSAAIGGLLRKATSKRHRSDIVWRRSRDRDDRAG
jgi:hypothetical protein